MQFTERQAKDYVRLTKALRRAAQQAQRAARDLAAVALNSRPTKIESALHDEYMAVADRLSDITLGI